ncbi:GntR family transcriptional regulator, partial [Staphylococcus sp. SIMBA_130]
MIKTGKFPPNSQLPSENELVKMFGVSRSPIREALSVLAAGGLIESRQGGRSWVKEVNVAEMLKQVHFEMIKVEEVQNLLELRTIVESN